MRRWVSGALLLATLLLVAACGGVSPGGEDSFTGPAEPREDPFQSGDSPIPTLTPSQPQFSTDSGSDPAAEDASVDSGDAQSETGLDARLQASQLPQNRVIVHTATLSLVIEDVALAIDGVAAVADRFGGWVVNSNRRSRHTGSISIRVPAQSLETALGDIEALALEIEETSITSQDVTEEYVDSQSRLASLRATEQRLLSFLDQAENVEEALEVERQLGALQLRIEEIQGRLNYLSQVAAFSLINVNLRLTPFEVDVDPGEDAGHRVGQSVRFQASFAAPPGVDDFSFEWDFGDGASCHRPRQRAEAGRPARHVQREPRLCRGGRLRGDYRALRQGRGTALRKG